jgi:predicted site-specific integrase-resolvase
MKRLLRKKEMAKELSISERTLTEWMCASIVPYIKVNRAVLFESDQVLQALHKFECKSAIR